MQNKTLRILFECKRTNDAWLATENKILRLDNLFRHEIAKLCFKHHTHKLPAHFQEMAMPTLPIRQSTHHYNLRNNTDNQYNYLNDEKYQLTFSYNCIKSWNNLPYVIKKIAYTNYGSYQHFKVTSKQHYMIQSSII